MKGDFYMNKILKKPVAVALVFAGGGGYFPLVILLMQKQDVKL